MKKISYITFLISALLISSCREIEIYTVELSFPEFFPVGTEYEVKTYEQHEDILNYEWKITGLDVVTVVNESQSSLLLHSLQEGRVLVRYKAVLESGDILEGQTMIEVQDIPIPFNIELNKTFFLDQDEIEVFIYKKNSIKKGEWTVNIYGDVNKPISIDPFEKSHLKLIKGNTGDHVLYAEILNHDIILTKKKLPYTVSDSKGCKFTSDNLTAFQGQDITYTVVLPDRYSSELLLELDLDGTKTYTVVPNRQDKWILEKLEEGVHILQIKLSERGNIHWERTDRIEIYPEPHCSVEISDQQGNMLETSGTIELDSDRKTYNLKILKNWNYDIEATLSASSGIMRLNGNTIETIKRGSGNIILTAKYKKAIMSMENIPVRCIQKIGLNAWANSSGISENAIIRNMKLGIWSEVNTDEPFSLFIKTIKPHYVIYYGEQWQNLLTMEGNTLQPGSFTSKRDNSFGYDWDASNDARKLMDLAKAHGISLSSSAWLDIYLDIEYTCNDNDIIMTQTINDINNKINGRIITNLHKN